MKRRGFTIRWRGRGVARIIIPSHRCRIDRQGPSVSLGYVIIRWLR